MFEIYNQINKQFIPVPDAKEVQIKGWEDFTFFVHRPFSSIGFAEEEWVISEASTGCRIGGYSAKTEQGAIDYVTQKLKDKNTPEAKDFIRAKAKELRENN